MNCSHNPTSPPGPEVSINIKIFFSTPGNKGVKLYIQPLWALGIVNIMTPGLKV